MRPCYSRWCYNGAELVVLREKNEYMGEGDKMWPGERLADSFQYGHASSSILHALLIYFFMMSQNRIFIER